MHIFMTNDDGFEAQGIVVLARALSHLGRVTVVAPNRGRSSCSSSLSLHQNLQVWKKESYGDHITVYSCNGTTADCGKLALERILADDKPDLVVSGANNGFNLGSDCLYSGTMAGALEGVLAGIPSLSVSLESFEPQTYVEKGCAFAAEVVREMFLRRNYRGMLNLNIPEIEDMTWDNVVTARLGIQGYVNTIEKKEDLPGEAAFWIAGKPSLESSPGEDVYEVRINRKITLTPITWDMTHRKDLAQINYWTKEIVD
jgi:5'-nucleotidase